ncbi:hypothetical protein CK203_014607 [Vitis vinifera]|uniref:Katanin p80 subunit C-terminal domain-containing protein n=1 Tax=Vitis vinifera TaxID=29760 RepID=A0A438K4M9_VITVI|nr:hypothetical protein CK203_014607 [Vitis vinifera]
MVRKGGGRWCSCASREGYGVGLWKAIRNGWIEFNKKVVLRWGMVEEYSYGRIGGVERIPWKVLFQACTLLSTPEMLGTLLTIEHNYLQVVHRFWERNDIKGAIGAMEKMADHSVSICIQLFL